MAVPIATIIRFKGDPDDLLERFDQAQRRWLDTAGAEVERPLFHATCRTDDGIAIVSAWETAVGHRSFGEGIAPHVAAVAMGRPDRIERMRIDRLGWD